MSPSLESEAAADFASGISLQIKSQVEAMGDDFATMKLRQEGT